MVDDFSADVDELRSGAKTHLGDAINTLLQTSSVIRGTVANDSAFDNLEGGDGVFSGILLPWAYTRDNLLRVIADNTENLRLSQAALLEIADRYERTDQNAAASMNRIAEGLS
jgi:hypothetical protein